MSWRRMKSSGITALVLPCNAPSFCGGLLEAGEDLLDGRVPQEDEEPGEEQHDGEAHALGGGLIGRLGLGQLVSPQRCRLAARLARTLAPSVPASATDAASSDSSSTPSS